MALDARSPCSWLSAHPRRHITANAPEEILCGPPHKISYTHSGPSVNFETARHSIGSTKPTSRLGRERKLRVDYMQYHIRRHRPTGTAVESTSLLCREYSVDRDPDSRSGYPVSSPGLPANLFNGLTKAFPQTWEHLGTEFSPI